MENDILSIIERESAGFSKGQRLIAKYILENYDKAAFMTAGKLGKTVGVSESTVVRFAAELGYDGYPEMRKVLQEVVRNKLTSVQRIEVASEQINGENIVDSVMTADADRIQTTLESINRGDFDRAVSTIINAKKVYINLFLISLTLKASRNFFNILNLLCCSTKCFYFFFCRCTECINFNLKLLS